MEIEVLEMTDTKAKFIISDASPSLVNALRRSLISDVPKMAIDNVEFHLGPIRDEHGKEYESATPLFDEVISHRLGMIPVPTDLDLFVFRDECVCDGEGCPNCSIMYSLNKRGPSDDEEVESATVYSDELQLVTQKIKGMSEKKYAERFQINEKIPIVKLNKSQALLLYATAILGTGTDHAKWQASQAVGYQYYPVVEIDYDKCDSGGSCVDSCPRDVLLKRDDKVIVDDLESCSLCKNCEDACSLDAISISWEDTKFIFQFETDGSLTVKEVLMQALNIIKDDFEELGSKASKLK